MRDIISYLYADGNHPVKQKKLKMKEEAGLNAGAMSFAYFRGMGIQYRSGGVGLKDGRDT